MLLRIAGLAAAAIVAGSTTAPVTPPRSAAVTYVVRMNGGQETPANNTKGTGSGTFTIDGSKLKYSIDVKDLSGAASAAHIHVGAMGVSGPPVYTFAVKASADGNISEGTIDLTTDASAGVSGDSLRKLMSNGNAYVNVHTKNFPAGEVRGQAVRKQ